MGGWPDGPVLVVGFARTGRAVAGALTGRALSVRVLEDAPDDDALAEAGRLGVELCGPLAGGALDRLVGGVSLVVVSPGVTPAHPARAAAASAGVPVISEIELAWRVATTPIVAITGTNGKTTVTTLVAAMASRSGRSAVAAGNIGLPLIEAVLRPDLELVVAEVSSFQLADTVGFHAPVAAITNLAADHLDWHGDVASYRQAKARLFAHQRAGDVAVANAEDAAAMALARSSPGRLVTFGLGRGDYHLEGSPATPASGPATAPAPASGPAAPAAAAGAPASGSAGVAGGWLVGPDGLAICEVADLPRRFPHDVANVLAAMAAAEAAGVHRAACRAALADVAPLAHRVELVARHSGVDFYDDSKATTPAAVVAALAAVGPCVLIAGGRNKGLDLREIARTPPAATVRAVVAIGEAAGEVADAFHDSGRPLELAASMDDAVARAARLAAATQTSTVLLSPGCASFDWYSSYAARGEDFARAAAALAQPAPAALP